MKRYEVLDLLAQRAKDQLVVTNLGFTANEWQAVSSDELSIYSVGMGLVTPVALGLAISLPHRRIISLDGDGSLLLDLSVLSTVSRSKVENLTIIAFDNKSYESVGGTASNTDGYADLVQLANASGMKNTWRASTQQQFEDAIGKALAKSGSSFISVQVEQGTKQVTMRTVYGRYNKFRFIKKMQETEGATILHSFRKSKL